MNAFDFLRFFAMLGLVCSIGFLGWLFRKESWYVLKFINLKAVGLACLFILSVVSFSSFSFVSLLEISLILAILYFGFLVGLVSKKIATRIVILVMGGVIVLVLFIYSLYALDYVVVHAPYMTRWTTTPGFPQVRLFSDVAVGLMPLALLYVVSRARPSRLASILCVLPLAIWWYFLFISEGRSGLLSLSIAIVVATLLFKRAAIWPVAILSSSAVAGLLGWWFFNPLFHSGDGTIFQRSIASNNGRFELWSVAIRHGIENFPLGVGPMHYAGDGRISYAHAHNLILNTAAEWGIPLALMLLALIVYGCWKIYQRSRIIPEADKPIYACLVMAFVGVMVNVQFAGAHIFPLSSLVMMLAIGLVFGYRDSEQPPLLGLSGPVPIQATLLWAGIMLMMAYLLHAGMELYWLSVDSQIICMQEVGRAYLYPRFWAQGRLECMQMIAPDHWLFWSWR